MKKKILTILITILALCMCMFTLTACGEKVTETFESGEPLGHSFTNYIYNNDATF